MGSSPVTQLSGSFWVLSPTVSSVTTSPSLDRSAAEIPGRAGPKRVNRTRVRDLEAGAQPPSMRAKDQAIRLVKVVWESASPRPPAPIQLDPTQGVRPPTLLQDDPVAPVTAGR